MPWANGVFAPICQVDIHTEEKIYSFKGTTVDEKDPSNDLISVNTNKSFGSPTGSWSMELIDNNQKLWYKKINPQDLVVIKMGYEHENLDTIMVGLVDEIRKKRSSGSKGEKVVRTSIHGRDLGKVLVKALLKWFPQFRDDNINFPFKQILNEKFAGMASIWMEIVNGSPAVLIEKAITAIIHNLMDFKIRYWQGDEKVDASTKEIFRYRLAKVDLFLDFREMLSEFEGSAWNFMKGFQHDPFYELFIDTRVSSDYMEIVPNSIVEKESYLKGKFEGSFGDDRSKAVLFFRKTPFDKENWDKLLTHEIEDIDIIDEDISRSDHENYNMFLATPSYINLEEIGFAQAVIPEFSPENLQKFGISLLEKTVNGLPSNLDGVQYGMKLTEILKKWYEKNIDYENGTQIIRGNGKIKIGHRLLNKETNTIFYIEGVSNNFINFGNWKTSLVLTRGQEFESDTIEKEITDITPEGDIIEKEPVKTEPVYYTVVRGDTLWAIAIKYYGKGADYQKIVAANKDIIKNPDLIYPGQRFLIPNPTVKG